MGLKLRVKTKNLKPSSLNLDEELEPVSPTSEYLLSELISLYVLCFLELETPVHLPSIIAFLEDLKLKTSPRFSSIPTVNDVVIGIIFYATQLYILETNKGSLKNARSTATIMVNIRSGKQRATKLEEFHKEKAWGNRISSMTLPLPKFVKEDLTNPLEFIKNAHKIVKAKRSGVYSPFLLGGLLSAIKTIGGLETAARIFQRTWKNSSFGITNLVGPVEQVSFGNHPINGLYFAPIGVNLHEYAGWIRHPIRSKV